MSELLEVVHDNHDIIPPMKSPGGWCFHTRWDAEVATSYSRYSRYLKDFKRPKFCKTLYSPRRQANTST